jgi:NAD(P)-dependent dehydrogenase (short-subunit alcohol dehydrogenase family)
VKQSIVIFGGSSGIGLQLTKRLLELGNYVTIVSRNEEKLLSAKQELGHNLSVYRADAGNENEIAAFMDIIEPVDHLIITIRGSNISDLFIDSNTEKVKKAFDEKFWTQYNIVRHGLRKIKSSGSIIMTSGIASQRSYPSFYWHACANGAIETLAKSLCREILPVRINVVSPAFVECKPNDTERLKAVQSLEPEIPLKRLASKDEIVEGYLYLMKNSYVTGSILTIDGGILNA